MATTARPRSSAREAGAHGVVYVSGVHTGGCVEPHEALQGRRIRGIFGGRGQFVAVVDAWELDWPLSRDRSQVLEQETVALGLKSDPKIHQVAFGERHRAAVSLDGHLYSWGVRDAVFTNGELGHVASTWHPVTLTPRSAVEDGAPRPVAMAGKKPVSGRPMDPEHADDEGDNQFEDRDKSVNGDAAAGTSVCLPRRVHAPKQLFFTKVACGAHHSVAISDKGDLYAWGRNFEGQLGLGATTLPTAVDRSHNGICAWPKYVSALLGKPPAVDVVCGDKFTVALLSDGTLWRWGERVAGITGRAHEKTDAKPRRLRVVSPSTDSEGQEVSVDFVGIAAGISHALAVTKSGELFAWGLNAYGQLGLGDDHRQSSDAPLRVPSAVAWTKVFAGSNYSAAIASDGQLFTWGSGHHGKLGHGSTRSEFAPRAVESLRGVCVSSVVCGHFHLYAFAPTVVTSISPTAGELAGGYEMRINGSGFWDSEDLTIRFVPLTEGRLPRGALARFDEASREIVCQVPTFNLPGEFAVEVATDGRHFTTDGHVFEAFKRPLVTRVSRWEARLAGGDEVDIEVDGVLPRSCTQPLLGLVVDGDSSKRVQVAGIVAATGNTIPPASSPREVEGEATSSPAKTLLRFVMPLFPDSGSVLRCALELSFNGGRQFSPVYGDSDASAIKAPFVLHFHDAAVTRCRPNSFHARALPTTIELDVRHLLRPTDKDGVEDAATSTDWNQLSVGLRIDHLNVSDPTTESRVDVVLPVERVQRSEATGAMITCCVPPITQWKLSKLDAKSGERTEITTDWWKFVPRWGFEATVRVSMNGAMDLLPAEGGAVYGVFSVGKLLHATPLATPSFGGTVVSIAADYFHFDTDDAVALLRWKDLREVRVAAKCRAMASAEATPSGTSNTVAPLGRRLTFTTAALPFPLPPPPPVPTSPSTEEDGVTPLVVAEEVPATLDDTVGPSEDIEVLVSLDGRHFQRESPLRLSYFRSPELLEITPSEALPGTRMVLKLDKAPPVGATAPTSFCVRLATATLGLSTVVPVEVNEPANTVEFELPALPIVDEDAVRVAFSLDGQQFSDDNALPPENVGDNTRSVSFRYRAPPVPGNGEEAV